MNNRSTFSLAQGVFRRNLRLDFMDGSKLKQRILISEPSFSQPYFATRNSRISSSVRPCSGLFGCSLMLNISAWILEPFYNEIPAIGIHLLFEICHLRFFLLFPSLIGQKPDKDKKQSLFSSMQEVICSNPLTHQCPVPIFTPFNPSEPLNFVQKNPYNAIAAKQIAGTI